MRLSLRFVLPLALVLACIAWATVPLVDQLMLGWFVRDIENRSTIIANVIEQPLEKQLEIGADSQIILYFDRITQNERLFAMCFCPTESGQAVKSSSFPPDLDCNELKIWNGSGVQTFGSEEGALHITVHPINSVHTKGRLILLHDMSFVSRRTSETKRYVFYFFLALTAVVSLVTVVVAQLSWRGWMAGVRSLLRGEGLVRRPGSVVTAESSAFRPIARDLQQLIRGLESETRARDEDQVTWTADALRAILHGELRGEEIIVVSNREPYIHEQRGEKIEVLRPASGLVTALEPVMRACSGTWIAHGSGTADRKVVDKDDRVGVPSDNPAYQIRRVWLTPEEESGYYYGFANEGLWPLCHIAHVRPVFRAEDWTQYVAVNKKFADAVVKESKTRDPIVLVQDYHFALLPRMIREMLPTATIISFWHIPWPNPESFGICPFGPELLSGLLGSSIIGFHTQSHCNNFLATVEHFIEARVDREAFQVSLGGKLTAIRRYPISIEWPKSPDQTQVDSEKLTSSVRDIHGLPPEHLIGVGVDRLDYTKGIIERFRAVDRLFELNPEWIGHFTFIQIASPTRQGIDEYQDYANKVQALADRINEKYAHNGSPAIILKCEHHEKPEIDRYFRSANVCVVSSLQDGMNLVAKEFVASRQDKRGVLILSQFTGAARELPEAIIVNPYDIDQCAAALHIALTMSPSEQSDRMRLMRSIVAEFNIYRWAGRMLLDATSMRRRNRVKKSETNND